MDRFIAERAQHLAIVHLTRRDDLRVVRASAAEGGVDLLVTLCDNGHPTSRRFGVKVQGRTEALDAVGPGKVRLTASEARHLRDLPFPVALFVFTMEGDRGWYVWVGPNRQDEGSEAGWAPLDPQALARIVETASAWHDESPKGAHRRSPSNRAA